ncbi:hypothetical protein ABVL22_004303 [Salmonella enterica]
MKRVFIFAIGVLGLVAVGMWAERLVWINSDTYPKAFALDLYVDVDGPQITGKLMDTLKNQCGEDKAFLHFDKKENGYFLRCGFYWQKGVYSIRFKPSGNK